MQTITDSDFIDFVGKQESQFIVRPSELLQAVKDRLAGNVAVSGDRLPWRKTEGLVALRSGEVSLWAGINGHGKTLILGQVCAWALPSRWLIASMEMPPAATMERMMRQMIGARNPSDYLVDDYMTYTDDKLWIYDQTDSVKPERILGMCWYAASHLKVAHVIIDSLVKCGIKNDDYNLQKDFVDRLCWLAKTTGLHVHLVHHIRKGDKEGNIPDKFDIRGAGELTDLVDNVFIVHRNKKKEDLIAKGEDVDAHVPDCVLKVAKQRHGEAEPAFNLWLHKDSMQFVPSPDDRPMFYPRKEASAEDEAMAERIAIQEAG